MKGAEALAIAVIVVIALILVLKAKEQPIPPPEPQITIIPREHAHRKLRPLVERGWVSPLCMYKIKKEG